MGRRTRSRRHRLAPSLVVTVSAIACSEPRSRPATEPPQDLPQVNNLDHRHAKPLNPRHEKYGAIYVAGATCYVHLPFDEPPRSWQPQETKNVDCPVELDDPAWDACRGGSLFAVEGDAGASCVCSRDGNPPPPMVAVSCPKPR